MRPLSIKIFQKNSGVVLLFGLITFLIYFSDGLMSFLTPIFIESQVNDTLLMGFIFSFSSFIGFFCDLLFPKIFRNQPHFFFLKITLLSAFLFPLSYLIFPQHVVSLLIAMTAWGIYYELNTFSSFHFISTYVHHSDHSKVWGLFESLRALSYTFAPLLASFLLIRGFVDVLLVVFFVLFIVFILIISFKLFFVKVPKKHDIEEKVVIIKKTSEFYIWKLLFKKIWSLLFLYFATTSIESAFWTIGILYMDKLSEISIFGNLFLTTYSFPFIMVGIILSKFRFKFRGAILGKKKTALISIFFSGLFLSAFFFTQSVKIILLLTFCSSFFLAIAVPNLKATFEDYVSRLKNQDNELIGIQGSSNSLAYIFGPIFSAFLADLLGFKTAFSVLGLFLILISLSMNFFIPKKIYMPQKALGN